MTQWQAQAPTNIALIKYMGKIDSKKNIPSNASLSYTLNHLKSTVTLTSIDASADNWDASFQFSPEERQRFILHLAFLKRKFNFSGFFNIQSENNFPANCGLASSASSFAALTLCATLAFGLQLSSQELAILSRHGSGSSCRSFFQPWALWRGEEVKATLIPYSDLIHHVIVVSRDKKSISSSEAHQRVQTSPLFSSRPERAETRLKALLQSFEAQNWEKAYHIVWAEFWDMHSLFETCSQPFGYLLPESLEVLQYIRNHWAKHKDGPLVTMDAGPNVHLLFRCDQQKLAQEIKAYFEKKFTVF